ncbi:hypothetical protein SAMN05444408_102306 [Chryseobacterium takakiae]|jgi:hypothetical protein|uniref:Uncharacterized protein n=1 Tax=Chryseobacterium takakiae TaxID=1302685 RepID=A0A1M4UUP5_9FLAO|nr:hypothetical protein SAMN05444408_102306 [Chryseobacterium takakiae]
MFAKVSIVLDLIKSGLFKIYEAKLNMKKLTQARLNFKVIIYF